MSVRRIFVEKKPEYAVRAKELRQEIENYLGIGTITDVRVLIRYDVEDVSEEVYKEALVTIFSEPPVDFVYEESFPSEEGDTIFTVEYLPGQFDQRADSAEQCVKLLNEEENPVIKSATTYVISGTLTKEQALHFGVDYGKAEEQVFLLELLALSLYNGDDFMERDAEMNRKIYRMACEDDSQTKRETNLKQAALKASGALSGELLYMKFLQGIPVAGLIGGLYDGIYMKKVTDYAAVKLERRYLLTKSEADHR